MNWTDDITFMWNLEKKDKNHIYKTETLTKLDKTINGY